MALDYIINWFEVTLSLSLPPACCQPRWCPVRCSGAHHPAVRIYRVRAVREAAGHLGSDQCLQAPEEPGLVTGLLGLGSKEWLGSKEGAGLKGGGQEGRLCPGEPLFQGCCSFKAEGKAG